MAKIIISIDDKKYDEVKELLTINDDELSIYFSDIINKNIDKVINKNYKSDIVENKLSKQKAVKLLKNSNYRIGEKIVFASKNKTTPKYWANPSTTVLNIDFTLLLNDHINNIIYVFFIPRNSLLISDLRLRNDNGLIDLQIYYDDFTFTDSRSDISFSKYKIGEIKY